MAQCEQCGRQLPPLSWKKICRWCVQHKAAQRGEDVPYQRVETAPWARRESSSMLATQLFIGANSIVFLKMTLAAGFTLFGSAAWNNLEVMRLGANVGLYTLSGEWWRLFTNTFIHGGLLHFAFNMWCLWSLGRLAEAVYGHWTFAAVYILCGLSGSLGTILWNPLVSSVGASGAIFGIAGALISSFYLGEFSLPRSAISGMLRSVVAFVGYNLVFGAMIAHIDNAAHIGGLVMGLILGALIARVAPMHDDFARRIGVLLVGVVIVLGAVFWLRQSRASAVHAQAGFRLLNAGKSDEAIVELQKAVRQSPDNLAYHGALSQAYLSKHDYENAAREMERVVKLQPRDENALYQLGFIYLQQQDPARAQATFQRLLKIDPNSANGHAGLADTFSEQHRDTEALAEYEHVAAIDPGHEAIHYNLGVEHWRLKHYDESIASLLKQREEADDPDTEDLLADVYTRKGMLNEAEDARQRAARLQHP